MYDLRSQLPSRGTREGVTRRTMLRIGALAPLGLGLPDLLRAGESGGAFGRAKRCLMLYLWGGPSHIDLFDMKPDAPSEIRGEFNPIATKTPGIQISELLPNLAKQTDKIGFIRSVTHSDNNHSTSAHWMMTGHQHPLARENFGARRSDFPHIGSVLSQQTPTQNGLPTFVALPQVIGTTAGFVTPGQNGGFLGGQHDPFQVDDFPNKPDFKVRDINPAGGVTNERMHSRLSLLDHFDDFRREVDALPAVRDLDAFQHRAIDMVTSPQVRQAFDLDAESRQERERYGMQPFGQSLLMARRLLESGVKLATVYWHRQEPAVEYSWDTHANNFDQLKNRLVPQIDRPVSHLLEDLDARGLLDDTLVIWTSEFGRTPKINRKAGRDHWGRCNTIWMAGAGIPGGQAYGKSDKIAGEPAESPVSPADISATVFHLLGLDPHQQKIRDRLDREFPLSSGKVLDRFIGA